MSGRVSLNAPLEAEAPSIPMWCPKCEQVTCDGLCKPRTEAQQAASRRRGERATRARFARDMSAAETPKADAPFRPLSRRAPIVMRRASETGASS